MAASIACTADRLYDVYVNLITLNQELDMRHHDAHRQLRAGSSWHFRATASFEPYATFCFRHHTFMPMPNTGRTFRWAKHAQDSRLYTSSGLTSHLGRGTSDLGMPEKTANPALHCRNTKRVQVARGRPKPKIEHQEAQPLPNQRLRSSLNLASPGLARRLQGHI